MQKNTITAVMSIVGCVIGAGFLGGKELLLTLGHNNIVANSIAFALLFALLTLLALNFFAKYNICGIDDLSQFVGRYKGIVEGALLLCYMAVITTLLATVNDCMSDIFSTQRTIPIYSFLACIVSFVALKWGNKGVAVICTVSVPLIVAVIVINYCMCDNTVPPQQSVSIIGSGSYALYNIMMSAGVLSSIAANTTRKSRIVIAVGVGIILSTAAIMVLAITTNVNWQGSSTPILLAITTNSTLYHLTVLCIMASAITSIVASSQPVVSWLDKQIGDSDITISVVLGVCLLLSLFGLDAIVATMYPVMVAVAVLILGIVIYYTTKKRLQHI